MVPASRFSTASEARRSRSRRGRPTDRSRCHPGCASRRRCRGSDRRPWSRRLASSMFHSTAPWPSCCGVMSAWAGLIAPCAPQRNAQAELLRVVTESANAVLTRLVRATARLIVRQTSPRIATVAVGLAHGVPLARAQLGAEAPPLSRRGADLVASRWLGRLHRALTKHKLASSKRNRAAGCVDLDMS